MNPRKAVRGRVRQIGWLLGMGALLVALGPLFAAYGLSYSGRLALAQQASAADVVRGIDFGPVYLEEGVPGRYFLSAVMPQCPQGYWQARFEVLDANKVAVFSEDEIRFIGDFQFTPGERDSYGKDFTLGKHTGYYYFRFTSLNGSYDAEAGAPPVLSFAIRQRVLHGQGLWLPAAGLLLAGVLLVLLAIRRIKQLAAYISSVEQEEARAAPGVIVPQPQPRRQPSSARVSLRQQHQGIPWTEP